MPSNPRTNDQLALAFDLTHEVGVKRHPLSWFTANLKAVDAARSCGFRSSDPQTKLLVSMVVLRALDAVEAP